MKMKEIVSRTGLSERTIRYYEDRGLITPETYRYNGRTYHDYSEDNISEIQRIITLRQADFTLDEIQTMTLSPEQIPAILEHHHTRIQDAQAELNTLLKLNALHADSVSELVEQVHQALHHDPDYQPAMHFGQYDPETEQEKEIAIKRHKIREQTKSSWKNTVIIMLALCLIVLAAITLYLLTQERSYAPAFNGSTLGWYYYLTEDGLMRCADNGKAELVYQAENTNSLISFRTDEHRVYVLENNALYSIDPDGSNRYSYRPEFGDIYASCVERRFYTYGVFLLDDDNIYVLETSKNTSDETVLIRVPKDGALQSMLKLSIDRIKNAAIRDNILYVFSEDMEGKASITRYDLSTDQVLETDATISADYISFDGTDFWFASQSMTGEEYCFDVSCAKGENLSIQSIRRIKGGVIAVEDGYVLYYGGFHQVKEVDGDGERIYDVPATLWLMDVKSGTKVELDMDRYKGYSMFYDQGLLLSGRGYFQWVDYPGG